MNTPPSSPPDDRVAAERAVGVLGGMGPEATADFLSKLVAATPVDREQDHLRVFVDSNPKVPDRNRALAGAAPSAVASPGPVLAAMAAGLERAGADFLVMACNTAHAYTSDIRAAVSIPFVSMIDEARDGCLAAWPDVRRIGVLAAQGCLDAALYQRAFGDAGRDVVRLGPADQTRFMALLTRIKRGDSSTALRAEMRALGERLVADGADVVVAACTEVPLVLVDGDLPRPLFDPTAHLAARCVRYARRLDPLPVPSIRS